MKCYRIKHVPTGLYYRPSRHGSKANLSKRGKVYTSWAIAAGVFKSIMRCGYRKAVNKTRWSEDYVSCLATEGEFEIEEVA